MAQAFNLVKLLSHSLAMLGLLLLFILDLPQWNRTVSTISILICKFLCNSYKRISCPCSPNHLFSSDCSPCECPVGAICQNDGTCLNCIVTDSVSSNCAECN